MGEELQEVKKEEGAEQVGWPQSQTPPPLPGWPCPDSPYMRSSSLSKMTDCLSLSRSHCLMSSVARCHGDHENGAGRRMAESRSFPSQQHKAGRLSWSKPSAWTSLMLSRWRGAVYLMAPPKMEVCFHSLHLTGWRRSWRCCSGRPRQQMCCSYKWKLCCSRGCSETTC